MKGMIRVIGIALLTLIVVQCKTTKSKGGSGAAPTMTKAGAAAPGALTPTEATEKIQGAASEYVNSPTCKSNPDSPTCEMAQQQANPENRENLEEAVTAVSGGSTTVTPSGDVATPALAVEPAPGTLPEVQGTLNDINEENKDEGKAGWSSQQQWGVALMVVGAIGAVGGAVAVGVYRKELPNIRNEAITRAKAYWKVLKQIAPIDVSEEAKKVADDLESKVTATTSITEHEAFRNKSFSTLNKLEVIDALHARDTASFLSGKMEAKVYHARSNIYLEALGEIQLTADDQKDATKINERYKAIGARGNAAESLYRNTDLKLRITEMIGSAQSKANTLGGEIQTVFNEARETFRALKDGKPGEPAYEKAVEKYKGVMSTAYEATTKRVKAFGGTVTKIKTDIEKAGGIAAAKKNFDAAHGKNIAKGGIASVVVGVVAMLVGGYAYSTGGASSSGEGMQLGGGTGGADDTTTYINTLGDIAVQLQPAG